MTALPDWMRPPRPEGWFAEDLDHLPEAPRHTELMNGALVFTLRPRGRWHGHVVNLLTTALADQASTGLAVARETTIRLDRHNRTEPDLLVTTAAHDDDRTWFAPDEVRLVVEVVSPESAHRDRTVKLRKYAEAGIPHYWCIEDEDGAPVVHVYELHQPAAAYAPAGILRGTLQRSVPFEITLDLDGLTPPRMG
ncbi:Uma2 family endonuclease [Streptomyces erythrochromogenes]|uniref:Uma2 family endonuclease n=1 Tax=Streptomyces erythrochromogenes TaxID=285574 RepID=UPI0036799F12